MATLSDLLAECGLGEAKTTEQTKQASATSSTQEVDQVLENLGLGTTASVKTASENVNRGGSMAKGSLAEIYEQIMGDVPSATDENEGTTKVAASTEDETGTESDEERTAFGEMVGHYFNAQLAPYVEKIAFDANAPGNDEVPLKHINPSGGLTNVVGKPAEAALPMNHSGSSGEKIHATTKNTSPYSLAVKQKILKRMADEGIVGEQAM